MCTTQEMVWKNLATFFLMMISVAELVQRLGMEGMRVTRFVKQMEGIGLLTQRSDLADNRFILVTLTPTEKHIAQQMVDFT